MPTTIHELLVNSPLCLIILTCTTRSTINLCHSPSRSHTHPLSTPDQSKPVGHEGRAVTTQLRNPPLSLTSPPSILQRGQTCRHSASSQVQWVWLLYIMWACLVMQAWSFLFYFVSWGIIVTVVSCTCNCNSHCDLFVCTWHLLI